jgi:exodeoxyribonuclease III
MALECLNLTVKAGSSSRPSRNLISTTSIFQTAKETQVRLDYKLGFYRAILDHWQLERKKGKSLVICGDYNTAHHEIDLARPKDNEKISGFLRIERDWMDKIVELGYVDTFRIFNQQPGHYSWWDPIDPRQRTQHRMAH